MAKENNNCVGTCKDCDHFEPCYSGGPPLWRGEIQTPEDHCRHFKPKTSVGVWEVIPGTQEGERLCLSCDTVIKGDHWNFCSNCGAIMTTISPVEKYFEKQTVTNGHD